MANISPAPTPPAKRQRERSTAYPYLSLQKAIEAMDTIFKGLGKGPYDRLSIVKAIGHANVSGVAGSKVSALVQFGLLTREGNTYKMSDLTSRIIIHTSEEDRQAAIVESAQTPRLYANLVAKFSGQALPGLLNNILVTQFAIGSKVASEVAQTFKETMEFAGLLKNGVLRGGEVMDITGVLDQKQKERAALNLSNFVGFGQVGPAQGKGGQTLRLPVSGISIWFPDGLAYDLALGVFADMIKKLEDLGSARIKERESLDG